MSEISKVVKPLLGVRFKLSFDSKGRCTTFRKDQAAELFGEWVWLIEATDGMNYPLYAGAPIAEPSINDAQAAWEAWVQTAGWSITDIRGTFHAGFAAGAAAEHERCNQIVKAAWGANVSLEGLGSATAADRMKDALERISALRGYTGEDMGRVAGYRIAAEIAEEALGILPPTETASQVGEGSFETCKRCQGNGEIVTDWERYRHPHEGDVGDEAVAECPDCGGEGVIDQAPPPAETIPTEDQP